MNWFKNFRNSDKATDLNYTVPLAFKLLVNSGVNIDLYFDEMLKKGVSEEDSSRLYNLILIACGRKLIRQLVSIPTLPKTYVVRDKGSINFINCDYYSGIVKHIATLNSDTVTVLGMLSCEIQAFNSMLNELDSQNPDKTTEENISDIELLPPELPC